MKRFTFVWVVVAACCAGWVMADECLLIDLEASPQARQLADDPRPSVVLEMENLQLVCSSTVVLAEIASGLVVDYEPGDLDLGDLHLVRGGLRSESLVGGPIVVARGGRYTLVKGRVAREMLRPGVASAMVAIPSRAVLARRLPGQFVPKTADPTIESLVGEVDAARWYDDVTMLAAWNRQTLSSGNLMARDWIGQQFTNLGLAVTMPPFSVGGSTSYNVVGTAVGSTRPDDWYLFGGHFDSMPSSDPAPGAEDNASGCAGVLEMARIFMAHPHEGTLIFICYSGEEQGLLGSKDHASDIVNAGDTAKVKGMVNMDMIGFTADPELDVLLEGSDEFQWVIDAFANAAATYAPQLVVVTSTFYWGSDHAPYLDRHMPSLLTIEDDWDQYPYYHQHGDVPANLSQPMGGAILEMNVAAMAQLVGVSVAAEIFSDGFENGSTSAWDESVIDL